MTRTRLDPNHVAVLHCIGPPDGIYLLSRADREELGDLAAALSQSA